ncbi:MAG: alpha/beta fold hydrolase [Acidimicrobiales bacterium]
MSRVAYDEFALFHENAAEFDLPFADEPIVRRRAIEVEPGRSLSALVWGESDPQLVLLHGGAQNAHTWDTVALALRPRSLVAIDLPGHGHSDGPGAAQRAQRTPTAAALDVAVVIRALAPDAACIVGMSYGGLTALALTAVAPELVRRLVLVDVLPGIKAEHSRHITDFVNGPVTFPSFDEILHRTMQFNPNRSESSLRRGILHNALQLDDGSWVWRHSRWRLDEPGALDGSPGEPADERAAGRVHDDLLDVLERVSVPLLLARGMRQDSVLRDDDEAALRRRLPTAEVEHFAEAGHSIQGDMPIELAAAIDRFASAPRPWPARPDPRR